jgi:hypothetical protein
MKKILFTSALFIFFIEASAYRIEYGNNVFINQPVYENLYIGGGSVTINSKIIGDLIVAGGTVIINDTITNDILLVAGTATINGFAGGDIRCAGGNIRITKNVNGDVVIAGGSVIIDKGVTIGGLIASGGDVTLDGNVIGDLKGAFGDFFLNGKVGKDVDCRGGRITINGIIEGKSVIASRYIVIGKNAVFNNDVRYWNKKENLDFKGAIQNGKAIFDPSLRIRTGKWYYLGTVSLPGLFWYLGMAFLMIVLIQYLFSATLKNAALTVFRDLLKSLGFGFLFFIAVPVAAIVAFVTIIGVPVGILLLVGYIILLLLATVFSALVAANCVNNRYNKNWNYRRIVVIAFFLFIGLKLLSQIPFVGWLFIVLVVCISFGAILTNVNWRGKKPVLHPVSS